MAEEGKKKNEDPPPGPRWLFKRDKDYSPNFVIPVPQENRVVPSPEALAKAGVIRVEPGDDQNENGLSTREKVVYGLLASLGVALISALALFLGGVFDSVYPAPVFSHQPDSGRFILKWNQVGTYTDYQFNVYEAGENVALYKSTVTYENGPLGVPDVQFELGGDEFSVVKLFQDAVPSLKAARDEARKARTPDDDPFEIETDFRTTLRFSYQPLGSDGNPTEKESEKSENQDVSGAAAENSPFALENGGERVSTFLLVGMYALAFAFFAAGLKKVLERRQKSREDQKKRLLNVVTVSEMI
eukprot:100401_1